MLNWGYAVTDHVAQGRTVTGGRAVIAGTEDRQHAYVVLSCGTDTNIADGVAGRRPIPAVLDDLLLVADDAMLVQEASIITGMRMLLDHAGLVVEPSTALGIATIVEDRDRFAGRHVVTIVCGSNVDIDAYHRWVDTGSRGPSP
jgi:threonine dehydratase